MENNEGQVTQDTFMLTVKQLEELGQDLIEWGKAKNLKPAELSIILLTIGESIAQQIGLIVKDGIITNTAES